MDSNDINRTMKREIDLRQDAIYVVVNGSITILDKMLHGTDTIHWNRGNVDVERSQRIRCNGDKIVSGNVARDAELE